MEFGNPTWLVPIVVALIAPLLAYLAAARRASGRIGTTEAERIWEEAGDLRRVYREEIDRLREDIVKIEGRLSQLETENQDLRDKNTALEQEIQSLHSENEQLKRENARLSKRVHELEKNSSA